MKLKKWLHTLSLALILSCALSACYILKMFAQHNPALQVSYYHPYSSCYMPCGLKNEITIIMHGTRLYYYTGPEVSGAIKEVSFFGEKIPDSIYWDNISSRINFSETFFSSGERGVEDLFHWYNSGCEMRMRELEKERAQIPDSIFNVRKSTLEGISECLFVNVKPAGNCSYGDLVRFIQFLKNMGINKFEIKDMSYPEKVALLKFLGKHPEEF